jgi:multisubunit Na+/H+ antiporter MnhC subunit
VSNRSEPDLKRSNHIMKGILLYITSYILILVGAYLWITNPTDGLFLLRIICSVAIIIIAIILFLAAYTVTSEDIPMYRRLLGNLFSSILRKKH